MSLNGACNPNSGRCQETGSQRSWYSHNTTIIGMSWGRQIQWRVCSTVHICQPQARMTWDVDHIYIGRGWRIGAKKIGARCLTSPTFTMLPACFRTGISFLILIYTPLQQSGVADCNPQCRHARFLSPAGACIHTAWWGCHSRITYHTQFETGNCGWRRHYWVGSWKCWVWWELLMLLRSNIYRNRTSSVWRNRPPRCLGWLCTLTIQDLVVCRDDITRERCNGVFTTYLTTKTLFEPHKCIGVYM